jgi:hypothetical protein
MTIVVASIRWLLAFDKGAFGLDAMDQEWVARGYAGVSNQDCWRISGRSGCLRKICALSLDGLKCAEIGRPVDDRYLRQCKEGVEGSRRATDAKEAGIPGSELVRLASAGVLQKALDAENCAY